jgi:hypothetical protein
MLASHIIFPMKCSKWIANLVPIRKNIGDIRLCVNFCALNKASTKDNFPLSNMDLIFQQVEGSQMMSLLDGFLSYNQLRLKRVDIYKTKFTIRWVTFAYEHMPFGLIDVGATF